MAVTAKSDHSIILNIYDNSTSMAYTNPSIVADHAMPGLKVERFLDESTGQIKVHYLWRDVLVPKVQLGGKIAEQISGLALIKKDLENAKRWIIRANSIVEETTTSISNGAQYFHAKDREKFDDAKAFFVAALTFYGKAYTEAEGRKAQMKRDWLSAEFRERHDFYMNFRHNFAAHSGDLKMEYAISYLLLIPISKYHTQLEIATIRLQPDHVSGNETDMDFVKLLDHAISVVDRRSSESCERLIASIRTRPASFWHLSASAGSIVDMDQALASTKKRRRK